MDQRMSLVTLGVADTERARACSEALGWSGESPDGDVVFFQRGGMFVALWGRENLAEAEAAGATIRRAGSLTFWGGYSGVFIDPEGAPGRSLATRDWVLVDDGSVRLR